MDERRAQKRVKALYNRAYASRYRESDETSVRSDNHARRCEILQKLTGSFDHEIAVLDLGCGSGRYFHCVNNAARLLGLDLSSEMLQQAKHPVLADRVTARSIELRPQSLFAAALADETFECAYAIGVLGEHARLDSDVCDEVHRVLKRDGVFFFTAVDAESMPKSGKRRAVETVGQWLPRAVRRQIDAACPSLYVTESQLGAVLEQSRFLDYTIVRHGTSGARWSGAHFECVAVKH